jgi:hypothetical protein
MAEQSEFQARLDAVRRQALERREPAGREAAPAVAPAAWEDRLAAHERIMLELLQIQAEAMHELQAEVTRLRSEVVTLRLRLAATLPTEPPSAPDAS